jgi:hypothetical protein
MIASSLPRAKPCQSCNKPTQVTPGEHRAGDFYEEIMKKYTTSLGTAVGTKPSISLLRCKVSVIFLLLITMIMVTTMSHSICVKIVRTHSCRVNKSLKITKANSDARENDRRFYE